MKTSELGSPIPRPSTMKQSRFSSKVMPRLGEAVGWAGVDADVEGVGGASALLETSETREVVNRLFNAIL